MKNVFVIFAIITNLFLFSKQSRANEIVDNLASPIYVEQSKNVLLYGGLATASIMLMGKDFDQHNENQIRTHNPLGKWSTYGNNGGQIYPNIAYALYNIGMYFHSDDNTYEKRAIDMFNATLYSGLVTDVLKPIIAETRPNGGKQSFPSGHTTTAFAFASYVALEHPWYVGTTAYLFASYVGLCRMNVGAHFPHDVVAGATIGMAYGMAQYYRGYLTKLTYIPMILPVDNGKGLALKVSREF